MVDWGNVISTKKENDGKHIIYVIGLLVFLGVAPYYMNIDIVPQIVTNSPEIEASPEELCKNYPYDGQGISCEDVAALFSNELSGEIDSINNALSDQGLEIWVIEIILDSQEYNVIFIDKETGTIINKI